MLIDCPAHSVMLHPPYGESVENALLHIVNPLAWLGGLGGEGGGDGGSGTLDGGGDGGGGGGGVTIPVQLAPVTVYCIVDVHGVPG
jgi:hypothetical protein